jgi:hypothetical protein
MTSTLLIMTQCEYYSNSTAQQVSYTYLVLLATFNHTHNFILKFCNLNNFND